jgi:hypothetical protein
VHLHNTRCLFRSSCKPTVARARALCSSCTPVNVCGRGLDENFALHSGGVMMLTRRSGIHLDTLHPSCPPTVGTRHITIRQISIPLLPLPSDASPTLPRLQRIRNSNLATQPVVCHTSRDRARPRVRYSAFSITQSGVKCGSISWRSEPPRCRGSISAVDLCYTTNRSTADGVEGLRDMPGCRVAGIKVTLTNLLSFLPLPNPLPVCQILGAHQSL